MTEAFYEKLRVRKGILSYYEESLLYFTIGVARFPVRMCQSVQYERKEQPHLYWKDIDVVVEQVDRRHWLACGHHYEVKVTVRSDEYNLDYTDVINRWWHVSPQTMELQRR